MKQHTSISNLKSGFLFRLLAFCGILFLGLPTVNAQMIPLSNFRTYTPWLYTPAAYGVEDYHRLDFLHQHRDVIVSGLGSTTENFSYVSPRFGRKRNFGWGVMAYYDNVETERVFVLRPGIAVRLVENDKFRWSVGVSAGLQNLNSNYNNVPIYEDGDPAFSESLSSLTAVDAGLSTAFQYQTEQFRMDGQLMLSELTSEGLKRPQRVTLNFANITERGPLYPSLIVSGGMQFYGGENLWIGPRMLYHRNAAFYTFQGAGGGDSARSVVDLGARADFPRSRLWVSAGYRLNAQSVRMGMGMQFGEARIDTFTNGSRTAWGFNLGFTQPIGEINHFGPQMEAGLFLMLPSRRNQITIIDTILDFGGAFWKSDGGMNRHKDFFLIGGGAPKGILAKTDTVSFKDRVILTYDFPDPFLNYLGLDRQFYRDSLLERIGSEWPGVDNLMRMLVTDVIDQALHPDTSRYANADDVDSLLNLVGVELTANLRTDYDGAYNGTGMRYQGDLISQQGNREDSLTVLVNLDERDTLITIAPSGPGEFLNELELACLKLHAMRKKLEYELRKYYSGVARVTWEESARMPFKVFTDFMVTAHRRVFILKLRINTGNIYQKANQSHQFKLYFMRREMEDMDADDFLEEEEEDDGWFSREELEEQQGKKRRRKKKKK